MSVSLENESLISNTVSARDLGGAPLLAQNSDWVSASFVRWFLVPALLLLAGVGALLVDLPLAELCYSRDYPSVIRHVLDNAEPFGDAYGMLLISAAIFLLAPARRKILIPTIAAALGSGLAADAVKLLISRTRPQSFDLSVRSITASFGEWLPLSGQGSHTQSFPSAHTAVAVGFAVALCHYFPRGRVLFIAMAVMCGMQRVQTCAHFLSDAFVGAAIGWAVSHLVLRSFQNSSDQAPSVAA